MLQGEPEEQAGLECRACGPLPRSDCFRNSINLKLFLSDHLIKQDYLELLREIQNLHVESPPPWQALAPRIQSIKHWDSKDPCPGCSVADSSEASVLTA